MKKRILVVLCTVIVLMLSSCGSGYYKEDFLGKTSIQIEEEYGRFDCIGMPVNSDGLYRNTACGYTIREPRAGFLGTEPELLFFVSFDKNGVAVDTHEGYRPGN